MDKIIISLTLAITFGLGLVMGSLHINNDSVTCIEHVTVNDAIECSIFEWRGEMYATEFAPIYYQEGN